MKILKIECLLIGENQIQWHVVGRDETGVLKHEFSGVVARSVGRQAMSDILRNLAGTELDRRNQKANQSKEKE